MTKERERERGWLFQFSSPTWPRLGLTEGVLSKCFRVAISLEKVY